MSYVAKPQGATANLKAWPHNGTSNSEVLSSMKLKRSTLTDYFRQWHFYSAWPVLAQMSLSGSCIGRRANECLTPSKLAKGPSKTYHRLVLIFCICVEHHHCKQVSQVELRCNVAVTGTPLAWSLSLQFIVHGKRTS
jgi:hypothetical protein